MAHNDVRIVDPVLSRLAWGTRNAQLVGSALFPFVPAETETGKIPMFGNDDFMLTETERAPYADTNILTPSGINSVDVSLQEHDLGARIDKRTIGEASFDIEKAKTRQVQNLILLRHEKECATIAQNPAKYPTTNKIALSGSSKFTDPTSDPIGVVNIGRDAISDQIGFDPNTLVMAPEVFRCLRSHPKVLERFIHVQLTAVTPEILRQLFEVEKLLIGKAVYADSAGVKHRMWVNSMVLAYVSQPQGDDEMTQYDPTYGYTLRKRNYPQTDKYPAAGGKVDVVRNTDIFQVLMIGPTAGYLITNIV